MIRNNYFVGSLTALIVAVSVAGGAVCSAAGGCAGGGAALAFRAGDEFIYDQYGRVVLLRGVNVPGNYDYPFIFTPRDLDIIREFGFNFIRLGISWRETEPEEGKFDHENIENYRNFIREAQKRGIYTMPEVHQVSWCVKGGDIPEWMCAREARNGMDLGAIRAETDRFWNSGDLRSKLVRFWRFLAENFRDTEGVFGYDILNEPFSFDGLSHGKFERRSLFPFYKDVIQAIREVDPERLIAVEPNAFAPALAAYTEPLPFPNLVYAPHPYFLHGYGPDGLVVLHEETPEEIRKKYERYNKEARKMRAPLLAGEFGGPRRDAFDFVPDWLGESLRMQDELFIGSAVWVYHPRDGDWSIVDRDRKIIPFYFKMHRRLYPRYTAGKPVELYYSPESGSFTYKYLAAADACAPTEIYFPQNMFDASEVEINAPSPADWSYGRDKNVLYIYTAGAGEVQVKISRS